jgi:hypothetical protein
MRLVFGGFMGNKTLKILIACILSCFLFLISPAYSNVDYPFTSGQAVFVQSTFNSSLYTYYNYLPHQSAPQRLPVFTTNQAVFVSQPYATTQQTVTSYPSTYHNRLPYTENRYESPAAFPTTVAPAYPYGSIGLYVSSPYPTTVQSATYRYPYPGRDYTSTYLYPYTTSTRTVEYPPPVIERAPYSMAIPGFSYPAIPTQQLGTGYAAEATTPGYASSTYYAYPVATGERYPYPTTTTAVPELIYQPARPVERVIR